MTNKEAVNAIINKAINTGVPRGTTLQHKIGKLALSYHKSLPIGARPVTVLTLKDYIRNQVIRIKVDEASEEPRVGNMVVKDSSRHLGICLSIQKEVTFITKWPCKAGEVFSYRREGNKYYLENYDRGGIRQLNNFALGGGGTILTQLDEVCKEYEDPEEYLNPWGEHVANFAKEYAYPDTSIWYKDKDLITYFASNFYIERKIEGSDILVSLDCTAYFNSGSSGNITTSGYTGTYEITPSKVVRIVHAGNYVIAQLMQEKKTYVKSTADESPTTTFANLYAAGVQGKAYNSISLFSLLIIDIANEAMNLLEYSSVPWFAEQCLTIAGGYTDIQINKQTGELLVVKSDATLSTSTVTSDYFNCVGEHMSNDWVDGVFTSDGSSSATTHQVGYKLYSALLNTTTLDLDSLVELYDQPATITTLQGATVAGGARAMTFTQQPGTFEIFLKIHKVGYKYANIVWDYTPSADPIRVEYQQRELVALGMIEVYDILGTELFKAATAETGVYGCISTDVGGVNEYLVYKLSDAMVYNHIPEINRMYALRSFWPQLEGTDGGGTVWEGYVRSDLPAVPQGYHTHFFETRFAASYFGSSHDDSKLFVPIASRHEPGISWTFPGHDDVVRNDPDTFCALEGYLKTLFLLTQPALMILGRELSDSQENYDDFRFHVSATKAWSGCWISEIYEWDESVNNIANNVVLTTAEYSSGQRLTDFFLDTIATIEEPYVYVDLVANKNNFSVIQITKNHVFVFFQGLGRTSRYELLTRAVEAVSIEDHTHSALFKLDSGPLNLWNAAMGIDVCIGATGMDLQSELNGALKVTSLGHRAQLDEYYLFSNNALLWP